MKLRTKKNLYCVIDVEEEGISFQLNPQILPKSKWIENDPK